MKIDALIARHNEIAAAVAMYQDGYTIRQVAEVQGRSYTGTHKRLKSAGVVLRHRGPRGRKEHADA